MEKITRPLIGFIVAPMAAPLLLVVMGGLHFLMGNPGYRFYLTAAAWIGMFAFISMLVIGIPGYFLARKFSVRSFRAYFVGGAVLGFIAYLSLFVIFPFGFRVGAMLLLSIGIGALTSSMFWIIAAARR